MLFSKETSFDCRRLRIVASMGVCLRMTGEPRSEEGFEDERVLSTMLL